MMETDKVVDIEIRVVVTKDAILAGARIVEKAGEVVDKLKALGPALASLGPLAAMFGKKEQAGGAPR
jgi:hypothetical protein